MENPCDFSYDGLMKYTGEKNESIYRQHLSRQGKHGLCTGLRKDIHRFIDRAAKWFDLVAKNPSG